MLTPNQEYSDQIYPISKNMTGAQSTPGTLYYYIIIVERFYFALVLNVKCYLKQIMFHSAPPSMGGGTMKN